MDPHMEKPTCNDVGLEVLKIISNKNFLNKVDKISRYFGKIKKLRITISYNNEVRGAGLLLGIKTSINNLEFSDRLKQYKLLNVPAADNTVD